MIRPARIDDVQAILDLCPEYAKASGFEALAGYDTEAFRRTLEALIRGLGVLLVAESGGRVVGMAGAFVTRWYFSPRIMAQQAILWVKPEHRKGAFGARLVRELEAACIKAGAQAIVMTSLDGLNGGKLGKLYERCGYAPLEQHYVKQVEA